MKTALANLDSIPKVCFGLYPTPLAEMARLRTSLGDGCPRLFVKRDDVGAEGFGGNKVRKIEYAIAAEIHRGTKTIVTIGSETSNHARITAAVCAKLNLRCALVLNRVRPIRNGERLIPASRFVSELYGAEIHWVDDRENRRPHAEALVEKLNASGEQAVLFPLGLSTPLGALGYVQAFREAAIQLKRIGMRIDYIVHSSSSGGTQAGLIAGNTLFNDRTIQIIGVSPDDPADAISGYVAEIVNGIYQDLGVCGRSISPGEVTVLDSHIGDGYGMGTAGSKEALKLFAQTEGIVLDPIYTSKAAAAMIDWIRKGTFRRDDVVMFWHTGGQLAHFHARISADG